MANTMEYLSRTLVIAGTENHRVTTPFVKFTILFRLIFSFLPFHFAQFVLIFCRLISLVAVSIGLYSLPMMFTLIFLDFADDLLFARSLCFFFKLFAYNSARTVCLQFFQLFLLIARFIRFNSKIICIFAQWPPIYSIRLEGPMFNS